MATQASALITQGPLSSLVERLQSRPRTVIVTVVLVAIFSCLPILKRLQNRPWAAQQILDSSDAAATDPGLLKKHSAHRSFHVKSTGFTYPSIRVYYRDHPQADKLPSTPRPLPLLVFIHGLGGSAAQWAPLLTNLVNIGPALCIDLPGCGLSRFAPADWDAYTTHALVELLSTIIDEYRDQQNGQGVVLLGHSMGGTLAAAIASRESSVEDRLSENVLGLVALCPKASPPAEPAATNLRRLLLMPSFVFEMLRRWDRRGGVDSASVRRFAGKDSLRETRALQLRFNEQSRTAVWRRMAYGLLSSSLASSSSSASGSIAGLATWASLACPVLLVAGENDKVTPPSEVQLIAEAWEARWDAARTIQAVDSTSSPTSSLAAGGAPLPVIDNILNQTKQSSFVEIESRTSNTSTNRTAAQSDSVPASTSTATASIVKKKQILKTRVLPAPAAHSLVFSSSEHRVLSGLLQTFLADHIDSRLSLGWQLSYLSTEGKWEVKNLRKWQAVQPVSEPLGGGIFRAMKTMREVDESHCPRVFVANWSSRIAAVVDISHDSPVYDPRTLDSQGVHYVKFPTVSKLPPAREEVAAFIELIDRLRREIQDADAEADADADAKGGPDTGNLKNTAGAERAERAGSAGSVKDVKSAESVGSPEDTGTVDPPTKQIGVHCHYGFNRTGFFIVCYLVERCGWTLPAALAEFAAKRAPGIKHDYFVDTLFARYEAAGATPTSPSAPGHALPPTALRRRPA